MKNWKRLIPALIIITLILLQGCNRALMERAIALGDQPEPGSLEAQALGMDEEGKPQQQCKVIAFRVFCIGGEVERLLQARSPFRQRESNGLAEYDFREKYWLVTVSAFDGKIMSVRRLERPASSNAFRALKTQVDRRYGKGQDRSTFPAGLETNRGREMAIYSNKAEALLVWEMTDWQVRLEWKGRDPIQLIFEDTELKKSYLAGKP